MDKDYDKHKKFKKHIRKVEGGKKWKTLWNGEEAKEGEGDEEGGGQDGEEKKLKDKSKSDTEQH